MINKKKIINDPVYGFINIPGGIIYELIEHPFFQRLRRIRQLGLSYLVYPGAIHTRFQHSIGAMHLTSLAIDVIKGKGQIITDDEAEAVKVAILLHDIGHTPFSHSLENKIVHNHNHEQMSLLIMDEINREFSGRLDLAIKIFKDEYPKSFLHQLVSGQLDMDRLDYLSRDSFFTGVSEGVIGSERIIKMLKVVDDQLVVEEKGIYSIEKFLIARRLMYWQVYLHKTALVAELVINKLFERAKELFHNNQKVQISDNLKYFFNNDYSNTKELLQKYTQLDDYDVYHFIKQCLNHNDPILRDLSDAIINRKLPKIILSKEKFCDKKIRNIAGTIKKDKKINNTDLDYYLFRGNVSNNAYSNIDDKINILHKSQISDISETSDMLNISVLNKVIKKYYVCVPKKYANELKNI